MIRWFKHPRTGTPDPMLTITVITVGVCGLKFLLDGIHFVILGHSFDFGHTDPFAYGSLLAPILGAHSWQNTRPNTMNSMNLKGSGNVDSPD